MSEEQEEERYNIEDSSKFPSLQISLEEVRRNYDTEQNRNSNIEAKIGAIVAIDAIIFSVVGVFGQMHIVTKLAILIPALLAAFSGLQAFNSREYRKPGPNVDDLFGYARMDESNARKDFIQNYRQAVKHNTQVNNERMDTLDLCFLFTLISFLVILLSPLLDILIDLLVSFCGL